MARGLVRGPVQVHVSVTMCRTLGGVAPAEGVGSLEVLEVTAAELGDVLGNAGLLVSRAREVGRAPWRGFVVRAGERVIHHTFVTMEAPRPRLFKVYSHPGFRRRGAFAAVLPVIARALADAGHDALESSCNGANLASIQAHERAGFAIVGRTYHPWLFGVPLRPLVARLRAAAGWR